MNVRNLDVAGLRRIGIPRVQPPTRRPKQVGEHGMVASAVGIGVGIARIGQRPVVCVVLIADDVA